MSENSALLLIGEIYIDFTLPTTGTSSKLRLGGIIHAARGLWAINASYAVAAICPRYLVDQARHFLQELQCSNFIWLGEVKGAPNVMVIRDPLEIGDQNYEDLLLEEKYCEINDGEANLENYSSCLIFPGKYNIGDLKNILADKAQISIDIAYDIPDIDILSPFSGQISALITSTSSRFFLERASDDISALLNCLRHLSPDVVLLKENRGGSRVFDLRTDQGDEVPALLGQTTNSVGVGDVYSAVFTYLISTDVFGAAWKAARAATCYAQTTYPDDFRRDVQRSLALTVEQMRDLGGTNLSWHVRRLFPIYFAAPDFSYIDRTYIEEVINALNYHNFLLRRPIQENGELNPNSAEHHMHKIYAEDLNILSQCAVVFALPLGRDPGTLIEMGVAIANKKPLVTYDPLQENANTMVIVGSTVYSSNLDICLNGLFDVLSKLQAGNP
ncbi:nucleoside 2-deoxyribosyltransferase [Tistrella mobilis]|uniref:nucleoside 2-deoxyribosyltransferase n=1 Tax=Tistrella mobilis TaxID=171437 RepID=UPI000A30CB4C|nr:nucleoside 2-deoxyribosyltransferase [Tistrella mobilis]